MASSRTNVPSRPVVALRATSAALVCASALCLVAFRRGWVGTRPALLATLVGAAALALVAVTVAAVLRAVAGRTRATAGAEALLAAGLVAIAAGGLANWAFGLEGAVLVMEREPVRLSSAADVVALEPGPLADRRALEVTVALARLELKPAGPDGFRPTSRVRVLDDAGQEVGLTVGRGSAARYRSLLFRQGAFGFAPRIVAIKEGRTLLDTHVPFRTIREAPDGVSFLGEFEIVAEKLAFRGAVLLDDLTDEMKGHPRLELAAERDGRRVGSGELRPGEFATLEDGTRVTFAGLQRWSELDFAHRTYPVPMLAGLVLAIAGALAWPIAAWRRR